MKMIYLLTKKRYSARKAITVFLIALTAVFLVLILSLPFLIISPSAVMPNQRLTSLFWAGYSVASDLSSPRSEVIGVSASWTVPKVNLSFWNSFSAVWIGIGGQFDDTLIQIGTEQNSVNVDDTYAAWYELLPNDSVAIDSLNISPGDRITASIYLLNQTTNTWSMEIHDLTNGQSFKKNVIYESSMLSAEWIVERPTTRNRICTLSDFGQVTLTNCTARIGNKVADICSFPSSRFTMIIRMEEDEIATVIPQSFRGSSFTVVYEKYRDVYQMFPDRDT